MITSQIPLEATRAAVLRRQIPECVSREVDLILNKSTAWWALKLTTTTGETGAWKSRFRTIKVTLIGGLKQMSKTTQFRFNISGDQSVLQQQTTLSLRAHSDHIEQRQQNDTKCVVERASAREQQTLFEY